MFNFITSKSILLTLDKFQNKWWANYIVKTVCIWWDGYCDV